MWLLVRLFILLEILCNVRPSLDRLLQLDKGFGEIFLV